MTAPKTTTRRKTPAFKATAHPDIYEATMADAKRAGLFGDRPKVAAKIAAGGDGGVEAAAAPPAGQDAGDAA